MKASLTKQGIAAKYTFTRPVPVSVPKILNTFTGIKTVFSDPIHFKVPYGIKDPATSGGSILDCDEKTRHDADLALVSLFFSLCRLAPERCLQKYYRPCMLFSLTEILFRRWPNGMAI